MRVRGRMAAVQRGGILALLTLLAACTPAPAPDLPTGPARPPMWVVYDTDTRITILGSVHQLPRGLNWTGGRIATELAIADELVLELSPTEAARAANLFTATARDEPVPTLTARHGRTAETLADLATSSGLSRADADRTEDWALALLLGNQAAEALGLDSALGVEAILTRHFTRRGLPVAGLETAAMQLSMFDDLYPPQQAQMLRTVLDGRRDNAARTARLLTAWAAGDVPGLTDAAALAVADTPFLVEPMITARNRLWGIALADRLARPGDVFVAVGVGHLVGPGSLIEDLTRRGHRPMRLQ